MKTINDVMPCTRNLILDGKRLTKDDMAYQLSSVDGCSSLPFGSLLDFKRRELVEMFNSKFNTEIR